MDFVKIVPLFAAGGILSLSLLATTDSNTIEWPNKFDKIEVQINVKNGDSVETPIILKVSVDSAAGKSIEFKKAGDNGKSFFEDSEKEKDDNKKAQYKNLGKAVRQFIKLQHKLNLIKSQRWFEGEENTKFDELCKKSCPQTPSTCSICLCCKGDCTPDPAGSDSCCKEGDQSCKYQLNKNSIGRFFLEMRNLNTAKTGKYLSPVRAVMTFMPEENDQKYEKGSFWGSLIYGYVDYRYRKTNKPGEDSILGDVVKNIPTSSDNDNYFANVPQKFNFKSKDSEEGDLDKILDKLNKGRMKDLMQKNKNPDEGSLCGCCEENADKIECMINRNYSLSLKDEAAITEFETKFKTLNKECCKKAV